MSEVPSHKRVALVSLGCPKNQVDSELILGRLRADGYEVVNDPEQADTLVVNTCAFIDNARAESIEALIEAANWKQARAAGRRVIAAGCLVQRHGSELRAELPEIDGWLGLDDIGATTQVTSTPQGIGMVKRLPSSGPARGLFTASDPRTRLSPPWSAYVKISEGCDQQCAFCAIPTFRGKNRSRLLDDLLRELAQLAGEGVVEANLIAQDSTGWGRDLGLHDGLPAVVRAFDRAEEAPDWIRIHYLYPGRISDDLLDALSNTRRFVEYVDLPLQHAHPAVLRRMKRPGNAETYRRHLEQLQQAMPAAGIRSGFIVGFPGETDEEFQTLLDFVASAPLDAAGVFTYSHEESTGAFALEDDVPSELKLERKQILEDLVIDVAYSRAQQRVGSRLEVLIEGTDEEVAGAAVGRWRGQAPDVDGRVVVEDAATVTPGTRVRVEITEAAPFELTGRLAQG
ncbi:MAG: 30S ribosomal protein S12 methylthiotransferase RimO [Acidobacteriota bacterium]